MSAFGVIFTAFNTADLLRRSLAPWVAARASSLGGHRYIICAVNVPFAAFDAGPEDGTRALLQDALGTGQIDHLITSDEPMKETDARGAALRWLVDHGATDIWQADSDEIPTVDQIARIVAFWEARPHVAWARLSYRNRVFTPDQYLVQPFQPPRIHRVVCPSYTQWRATGFYDDNNVEYSREDVTPVGRTSDTTFAYVTIPPSVAWIDHRTWLNDERSKRKQAYQWARWGRCDFAWDESRGGLVWRDGLIPPETARDP